MHAGSGYVPLSNEVALADETDLDTRVSRQAIIGITLAITGAQVWAAWFVLAIMCVYISAYAWSWGPLGWLYSSEVQPLETRSAGQSITTLVNLMFSFVIGQVRENRRASQHYVIICHRAGEDHHARHPHVLLCHWAGLDSNLVALHRLGRTDRL